MTDTEGLLNHESKYLLGTCCVPGTVLESGNISVSTAKVPALGKLIVIGLVTWHICFLKYKSRLLLFL